MISFSINIEDEIGFHARTASLFAKKASTFNSDIFVEFNGKKVSAKSTLSLMTLGVKSRDQIMLITEGNDEKEAHEALISYIKNNFKEQIIKTLQGIVASWGLAIGEAQILYSDDPIEIKKQTGINSENEISNLKKAIDKTIKKIDSQKVNLSVNLSEKELEIYTAFNSIVNDPEVLDQTRDLIKKQNFNAAYSYYQVTRNFISELESLDDEYLNRIAEDLKMLSDMVLKSLLGDEKVSSKVNNPSIVIAEKIDPSQIADINQTNLLGIITAEGGVTDHSSIIAKALGIPYMLGVKNVVNIVRNGDKIILDSKNKCIHINPEKEISQKFEKEILKEKSINKNQLTKSKYVAITKSGKKVDIMANVGSLDDAVQAKRFGADGIGLLRTELCFLESYKMPDEKSQLELYSKILNNLPEKTHTLRLIDFGSDKKVLTPLQDEENPALGQRALRLGFSYYDTLLKPQIRAFLKLSKDFNIKILCPMITNSNDLDKIITAIHKEQKELNQQGEIIEKLPPIGIMVEVPNVALNPNDFISKADFFSFGTNDLAQFLMAADRTNKNVSHYIESGNQSVKTNSNLLQSNFQEKEISIWGTSF